MSTTVGGKIKLEGESAYRKALSQINAQLRVTSSEMKNLTSGYDKNDKSVTRLAQENANLNKRAEEQRKKVELLKGALDEAASAYGKSDTKTLKWEESLNKAEAELKRTEREIEDNEKAMKESSTATDKNADSVEELGKEMDKTSSKREGLTKAMKAIGASIVAASAAIGGLVTMSVKAYANYEQLVGGVDTLFKSSSKELQDYANNAYKTAGLSANEYMETVTSFSASLIQSLNGDTSKAAEYANRAMIDMSDNANKMGTNMEDIQNAYQGFAKQNYTMLDNLKLGYGGTKSEMERLLADAEKISGVKYDISSYADITEAIHVMQEEMGIAGTTAKEASETIEGSVNATKAAWSNLVVGLADDNANFEMLINNLVDSATDAFNNIMPRVEQSLVGVGKLVSQLIPVIVKEIPGVIDTVLPELIDSGINMILAVVDGLVSGLPKLIASAGDIITNLILKLGEAVPQIITSIANALPDIVAGITEALPQIIDAVVQVVPEIIIALADALPQIVGSADQIIIALVKGIIRAIPSLIAAMPKVIYAILNGINGAIGQMVKAGADLIVWLWNGIKSGISGFFSNIWNFAKQIPLKIAEQIINTQKTGKNLISKLWTGFSSGISNFLKNIVSFAKKIPQRIANQFTSMASNGKKLISKLWSGFSSGIGSFFSNIWNFAKRIPSKIASGITGIADVGRNLIKGLWNGISDMTSWIYGKIKGFGKSVVNGLKDFFGIHSPSRLMEDEVGKYLAMGVGVGFENEMKSVSNQMKNAIPTNYDVEMNANLKAGVGYTQNGVESGNGKKVIYQTVNFNQPVSTPHDMAKMLKNYADYGLAGGI